MIRIRHAILSVILVAAAAAPATAWARVELFLEGPPQARLGQPVPVVLKARLDEPINAVRLAVRFDPAALRVTAADDRDSVVRYWLVPPGPSADGAVEMEGIIPGGVGPGFDGTVTIAQLTVLATRSGTLALSPADPVVYLNQPDPTEAAVTVRPLSIVFSQRAPVVSVIPAVPVPGDADVRVVREPALNGGAWSLVFDIRQDGASVRTVRVRERRFGLFGSWRDAMNTERLYDQSLTSILEVAVPDGTGQRVVGRVVPLRLQALWVAVAAAAIGLAALRMKRLS